MKRLGILLLCSAALVGCAVAPAPTREVAGSIVVKAKLTSYRAPEEGEKCSVSDGFSDIGSGTPVTVRDAKGEIIGMGELSDPTVIYRSGKVEIGTHSCILAFTVSDVPSGKDFYSIEVGNRGEVEFPEEEVFGSPTLTLG